MPAERIYEILRAPVVTEKTAQFGGEDSGERLNKLVFRVAPDATKADVKRAVETLFKVKVQAVNTLVRKGKVKRFRNRLGRRVHMKRAIVTLAKGESLDAMALAASK
ncbi:MAG: 50S ribosomal protein L23 [Hyphomicrobiales bacterium]|nr:50S ribosomal protein L23 [Hyphomicrobiales bacterium]